MSNSVQLHRVFSAPVERVYRAFTTADALVKWMAPHGFTAHVDQFDLREGGQYRMFFTNFSTGMQHSFHGTYLKSLKTVYCAIPMSSMYLNWQVKLKYVLSLKKYLSVQRFILSSLVYPM